MNTMFKFFLLTIIAMHNIIPCHSSDVGNDIALQLSNQLQGSIKYNVNEPRGKLLKGKRGKLCRIPEDIGILEPQYTDDLAEAKYLGYLSSKIAGLYKEGLSRKTLLSEIFKPSSLALDEYSYKLTSLCNFLHHSPPVLNSCFSLTLNCNAITRLNQNYPSSIINVCEIKGKSYLTLGDENMKKVEDIERIIHYKRDARAIETVLSKQDFVGDQSRSSFWKRKAPTLAIYLANEAVWRRAVSTNTQHLIRTRYKEIKTYRGNYVSFSGIDIHPIDEFILPNTKFNKVTSYYEARNCLAEILACYHRAQNIIKGMLQSLEEHLSFFCSKEESDNYVTQTRVLEWAQYDLKVISDYYEALSNSFKSTRKELISQIKDAGVRNDMCIHDPLYRFITAQLRVPDIDEHRRFNSFAYKFENNFLIPLINDVLIPGVKYVIVPLAIGSLVIVTGGTVGVLIYTALVFKAGVAASTAIGIASTGGTLFAAIEGGSLIAYLLSQ